MWLFVLPAFSLSTWSISLLGLYWPAVKPCVVRPPLLHGAVPSILSLACALWFLSLPEPAYCKNYAVWGNSFMDALSKACRQGKQSPSSVKTSISWDFSTRNQFLIQTEIKKETSVFQCKIGLFSLTWVSKSSSEHVTSDLARWASLACTVWLSITRPTSQPFVPFEPGYCLQAGSLVCISTMEQYSLHPILKPAPLYGSHMCYPFGTELWLHVLTLVKDWAPSCCTVHCCLGLLYQKDKKLEVHTFSMNGGHIKKSWFNEGMENG